MRSIIVLLLFIAMFLIVDGIYKQKMKTVQRLVRTEYRFVPRTLYDEILNSNNVHAAMKNHFDTPDPWYSRNIGIDYETRAILGDTS